MKIQTYDDGGAEIERDIPDAVKLHFKSPDAIFNALQDLPDDAREEAEELYRYKLGKWLTYGEYLTVEFNLQTMTATVEGA